MLRSDYSFTDRALTFWATLVVAILSVTSLILRYVTNPISCWLPASFQSSAVTYSNWRCFQNGEINRFSADEGALPPQPTYHQWVPFALGVGALLCLLPHATWRLLGGPLQLDTHALLTSLAENQRHAADRRHVMIRDTAILLHIVLKRGNFFLTVGALFRKLLACVTCLLQVALAVGIFRPRLSASDDAGESDSENASIPLPYGAFGCSFQIRQMARIEEYQVQCTMPLAQVYEKGFAFLFYFFFLLFVLCVLDLLLWTGRLIVPGLHDMQLKRYVEIPTVALGQSEGQGQETATVSQLYPRFSEYLGWDGRLLLALTADYCGPLAAADLTNHLWAIFKDAPLPAPAPAVTEPTAVVETTSGTEMKSVPLTDVGGKDEEKATGDQGSAAPQC